MIYFENHQFEQSAYNAYILKKHLSLRYGEERAINFIQANKNKLPEVARALGAQDITFFCLYYLQNIFVVKDGNEARTLAKVHYDMWNLLNDTFNNDLHDKINIVVSRGVAKTTVCDLALCVWLICYQKSKFTLLGAKKDDDACQFVDNIKKVFQENQQIIDEFGLLIDRTKYKVNSNEIEFANGVYLRAVGSSTSVRGANFKGTRPTVVIADDYQAESDIITEDSRQKKYDRWSKEIEQVGDKAVFRNGIKIKSATKIISIGTVLHNDCLISRLSRNNDYYTMLRRAIILKDDETAEDYLETDLWQECKKLYYNDADDDSKNTAKNFYELNKSEMKFPTLWEEKWDCFNDLAVYYWENRQAFYSEMMNDATSIGEKWFHSVLTKPIEEILETDFLRTMLCVDPASTTTKRSDSTATVVGSIAKNGFKYMRDIRLFKYAFNQYCLEIIAILAEYEDITHIFIEKNTYQGADVVRIKELILADPVLRRRKFIWINEMQRKNKDEKISTSVDSINNGQIIFVDNNQDFVQQILDFQGQRYSVHDDAPDITAECSLRLEAINTVGKVKVRENSLF